MQVEVKIKVNCPDGYEPADVENSFRTPKIGEQYVGRTGAIYVCEFDWDDKPSHYRLIVRPVWKWPPWLKARWIACDAKCDWFCSDIRPAADSVGWVGSNSSYLNPKHFDFIPPPCSSYRESLRENPNWNDTP